MNKETENNIAILEGNIAILEGRLEGIQNAIAVSRSNATPATHATVEMAIEELALPELAKVQAQLVEAKEKLANMDKFLNNPIFDKSKEKFQN